MAGYTDGVEIETTVRGGMMAGLRRSVLGGESFFINTFRSSGGGDVSVAPALPGDMTVVPIDGSAAVFVQSGSWIASDAGVGVDTKWGGSKTFFSGEGLFLLRCTGNGDMLVSSYGAILTRTLGRGRRIHARHRSRRCFRRIRPVPSPQGGQLEDDGARRRRTRHPL